MFLTKLVNTGKAGSLFLSLCQTPQPGGAGVGPHRLWYIPVRGQCGEVILHPQQPEECHRSRWVTVFSLLFEAQQVLMSVHPRSIAKWKFHIVLQFK